MTGGLFEMEVTGSLQIVCPIRGQLKVNKRSKDGLSASEEFYRVEAIKYLLSKSYPKENFWIEPIIKRFGNSGRNSFRSDFAVLDVPATTISSNDPDELLAHAIIICEVKRDNKKNTYVKNTQVKPMLDFAKRQDTLGLYWDNIEKRIFWIEIENGIKDIKEGPLSFVPKYGVSIKTTPLTFNTIEPADSLIDAFERIEDILHQASFSPEKRYEIILQLLLAKIFDEHAYEVRGDDPLEIQDYRSLGTNAETTRKKISDVVKRAVAYYGKHLPNALSSTLPLSGDTLFEVLQILAPIKIIHSKRDVVQTFYMKFAKDLYKWDMAQYFTPTTVTDFLVDIVNPQFGEHIADPACGSADFLVAAFRIARKYNPGFADCICSTSMYSDYDSSIVTNRRFSPRVSMPSIFPGHTPDYSNDFESELADVFCYSCFDEGEKYIVKLKYDYIKHNTIIAFPSVIFVKDLFDGIPYTITSKNSPEIVSGEIKITDDIQNQ